MKLSFQKTAAAAAIAASMALTACVDSTDFPTIEPTPPPPAPTPVVAEASGKAIKGALVGGVVSLNGTDTGATTADDGSFTATVTDVTGLQTFVVTGQPFVAGESYMTCDATACGDASFGDEIDAEGVELKTTVFIPEDGGEVEANANIFTTLVADVVAAGDAPADAAALEAAEVAASATVAAALGIVITEGFNLALAEVVDATETAEIAALTGDDLAVATFNAAIAALDVADFIDTVEVALTGSDDAKAEAVSALAVDVATVQAEVVKVVAEVNDAIEADDTIDVVIEVPTVTEPKVDDVVITGASGGTGGANGGEAE